MSPRVVAKRYAQALFELSQRQNGLDQLAVEVEALVDLYEQSRLLRNLLQTPLYAGPRKISWLRPVFEERLSPLLWNFLVLLIRRGREYLLNETGEAFLELYDAHKGRVRATVRAAQSLSSSLRDQLSQKLRQALQAQEVILTESVEPRLIGGFIVEVGTQMADLSVRGQLHQIQKNLLPN